MTKAAPVIEIERHAELLHSLQAEQNVIGAILLDNAAFDAVADVVAAADFFARDHRLLFDAMARMFGKQQPVDEFTLWETIERDGHAEQIRDGFTYLAQLKLSTPSAANVRRYAEIVRDRALLRRLAKAAGDIQELMLAPQGRDAQEVVDAAQASIMSVAEGAKANEGFCALPGILQSVVEKIDEMYHRDSPYDVTGVPTQFHDLDRRLSGLQPGDLIVVGARPSMGKSAFALNIAENIAARDLSVGIFSLEMPKEALGSRLLASAARLNHFKMRKGALRDDEWAKLSEGVARLNASSIHIDETSSITPMELRARARRLRREVGTLGLLVVDYLQLMQGGQGDTRQQQIGDYSRTLKHLAKELMCPVMALSQINRGVESRPDKRPNMSDLRESGDIEQDADVILFLYRDEVYNKNAEKGAAEVIIAKQRNGPLGTVPLTFIGELMRFENAARVE